MFSATVSVVVAVCFISFVRGLVLDREVANNAAIKCAGSSWRAVISAPHNEDELMENTCKCLKEFVQCVKNTDPADYKSPVPNMLHFILAYDWQLMVIMKRAGLCKDMQTDELRKITVATGIMKNENLKNVEEDSYKKCVGDAVSKCIRRNLSLVKIGMNNNLLTSFYDYIGCLQVADYRCDATMLDHFIAILKAFQKHLEQNNGKLGKMAENIEYN